MLPINCGSHADYQNFVVTNLRKYYPNPNALAVRNGNWNTMQELLLNAWDLPPESPLKKLILNAASSCRLLYLIF